MTLCPATEVFLPLSRFSFPSEANASYRSLVIVVSECNLWDRRKGSEVIAVKIIPSSRRSAETLSSTDDDNGDNKFFISKSKFQQILDRLLNDNH